MRCSARSALLVSLAAALVTTIGCGRKSSTEARTAPGGATAATQAKPIPRLVDLGARKCIPCKAMAPILEQLSTDYAGRLEVKFIDVWQTPEEAQTYRIQMIPTQIFYAADGRELARHEGFISREDILAAWKQLGVEL